MPGQMSYYNGETVGDFHPPHQTREARSPFRPAVYGQNWDGSQTEVQTSINLFFPKEFRAKAYDLTSYNAIYARHQPPAPALALLQLPAYALPNAALQEGNYRPQAPVKGRTTVYVKVG